MAKPNLTPPRRAALEAVEQGRVTLAWPLGLGRPYWRLDGARVNQVNYRWLLDQGLIGAAGTDMGGRVAPASLTVEGTQALEVLRA